HTLPIGVLMNRSESIREGNRMVEKFANVSLQFLDKKINKLGVLPNDNLVSKTVSRQIPYVILKENASVSKAMRLIVERFLSIDERRDSSRETTFVQRLREFLLVR